MSLWKKIQNHTYLKYKSHIDNFFKVDTVAEEVMVEAIVEAMVEAMVEVLLQLRL